MDGFQPQLPPNHNVANPSLKGPLRPSHIRARVAASPYPRDTDSVHSSSSETEDMSMFIENAAASEYQTMYGGGHSMGPSQEALHTTGAFGRLSLSQDHALEKLAANVRAATTTSASDRAKQIFVQAWYVFSQASKLHDIDFITQKVVRKLCPIPRWKCPTSGIIFLLSSGMRPVWDPPYQYCDSGEGNSSVLSYHKDPTFRRKRKQ